MCGVGRSCLGVGVLLRLVLPRSGRHSTQKRYAVGSSKRFGNVIERGYRETYARLAVSSRMLHFAEQAHYIVKKTTIEVSIVCNVVMVGVLSVVVVVLVVRVVMVPRFFMGSKG